ncbi:MAG: bifunctional UDP-N-acetylglucosamine diphosphorylase/glucosamine-1-phosphate N-acetyltransferase GlmU [Chloroflexi bacterium]|nr:bifunctional UDP-N-acetylglucosamine diphosphorylase/glucosamine-1-phosphate N-acetyltransferase GlmU [Chloroflexota bacterium]
MDDWAAIILAAGKGRRMKSKTPKVLHTIAGREMLCYVSDAIKEVPLPRTWVVVGYNSAEIRQVLGNSVDYVEQTEALGTGHALLQARPLLESQVRHVLVLNGDTPLIQAETLRNIIRHHQDSGATITLLTARGLDPKGLGRVIRNASGQIVAVVEEAEIEKEGKGSDELNGGVYCFKGNWLWPELGNIPRSQNGEYYLTSLIVMAAESNQRIEGVNVGDPMEALGINHRFHLAQAESIVQERLRQRLMLAGVSFIHPPSAFIDANVEIGEDTVIYPNTTIAGKTQIGQGCHIGPNAIITDSVIGNGCRVQASVVEGSILEEGVDVGPFSHIRPQSHIEKGVHIGNFAEVKKSRLGKGTKMGHFSFVGDAIVGENVNIGAGAVTCNFDGIRKHETVIGNDAFIGSDSMLIAPVRVGDRAITGAGSVVNHDVPSDALAVGVPARSRRRKEGRDSPREAK